MAVVGMFDGVHAGHRYLLSCLRQRALRYGLAPLAVTFSNHPLEQIAPAAAPKLLSTPDEKLLLLAREGVEVQMLPFDDALRHTPAASFLQMLRDRWGVSRLLLGFNNRFGFDAPRSLAGYISLAASEGIAIEQADEFRPESAEGPVSSSAVRALIAEGRVDEANRYLGRHYCVEGMVAHGKAIGRTIGFPTANVVPDFARKLIPASGVYAAMALTADGHRHPAMVNVGVRPTINAGGGSTIEANLIDFDGDLYGERLALEFATRLRSEQRFPDLDSLKHQILLDRTAALAALTPKT